MRILSYTEQAVESRTVTPSPCAEFPNDNPALHGGAIWLCLQVTGAPVFEPPAPPPLAEAQTQAQHVPEIAVEAEVEECAPVPELEAAPGPIVAAAGEAVVEPPTDPTPPVLEADDEEDDIEIVDELSFDEVIDESPQPQSVAADAPEATDDPFLALTQVLESVARASGGSEAAVAALRIVLGQARVTAETGDELLVLREQAAAWQGILRGDSEDFSACGVASLDEWSSIAVARCLGEMARADGLRRELRRRGVAAFGLVIEAA